MKRLFCIFTFLFVCVFGAFSQKAIGAAAVKSSKNDLLIYEQETLLTYNGLYKNKELRNICNRKYFVVSENKNFLNQNDKDMVINIFFVNTESDGYELLKIYKNLEYEKFSGMKPFKKDTKPMSDGNFRIIKYFKWN